MFRVLLISDHAPSHAPLKAGLSDYGLQAAVVSTEEAAREDFQPGPVDVVVVELEQSRSDARKLCHLVTHDPALRDLPLILLVPEAQLGQVDYSWGVEDYLTAPVSAKRLAERIKFLLWKLNKVVIDHGLRLGDVSIDFETYEVRVKGEPVDLTYKEFELLKFLATHPGKVFTREILLNKVWGYDYYGGTRTVDVHVRRLRSKIETGGAVYVQTVRNVGYKFVADAS